ncbi:MAG: YraN family protein [Clostridia bacterium]|nr:YraN family protein [Clostridia bacterium]
MRTYQTAKEIGDYGERIAARYLIFRGHRILARNYRDGRHELDLITKTKNELVFTEVKTRLYEDEKAADASAPPCLAVDADKQSFTRSAALAYLRSHPTKKQPRMDVIEVLLLKRPNGKKPNVYRIRHIKAVY